MKKVAKRSLYVQGDKEASEVVRTAGTCDVAARCQSARVRHYARKRIDKQNRSRRQPSDNRKPSTQGRSQIALSRRTYELDVSASFLFQRREKDDADPPSIDSLRTMDPSFDKRYRNSVKRVLEMKKYRERTKELLVRIRGCYHP